MYDRIQSGLRGRTFEGVQCLRFVAALMVVVLHSTFYASERLTPGSYIWNRGAIGVDIFFVISGFVMYVSSIHLEGERGGWREFATKRLIRIVPLYWAITSVKLLILVAAPALVLHAQLDWVYVAKSYLFIPAFNTEGRIEPLLGVGWTLIFEMFFYLIFSIALLTRLPVLPTVAVVLLACAAASLLRQPHWPAWAVYLDMRVLEFLVGMLIAKYILPLSMPRWLGATALFAGFALVLAGPEAGPGFGRIMTLVLPSTLIVLGAVALEAQLRGRFPRKLIFLGAASYSLYLVHPIVAPAAPALLAKAGPDAWSLAVAGSVTIALVASLLVYRFYERPVTRLLSQVFPKRPRAPVTLQAAD